MWCAIHEQGEPRCNLLVMLVLLQPTGVTRIVASAEKDVLAVRQHSFDHLAELDVGSFFALTDIVHLASKLGTMVEANSKSWELLAIECNFASILERLTETTHVQSHVNYDVPWYMSAFVSEDGGRSG